MIDNKLQQNSDLRDGSIQINKPTVNMELNLQSYESHTHLKNDQNNLAETEMCTSYFSLQDCLMRAVWFCL